VKILELEIQNNKAVKAFFKKLDGGNMEIAGDTEPGEIVISEGVYKEAKDEN
jgi:hypothetical protein